MGAVLTNSRRKEDGMKRRRRGTIGLVVMMTVLSAGVGAFGADGAPMKPELAAKREVIRKQEEQRVTPEKRKAAAAALKAERLRVHQAKEAAKKLNPSGSER
jgi:hypothetical protein